MNEDLTHDYLGSKRLFIVSWYSDFLSCNLYTNSYFAFSQEEDSAYKAQIAFPFDDIANMFVYFCNKSRDSFIPKPL